MIVNMIVYIKPYLRFRLRSVQRRGPRKIIVPAHMSIHIEWPLESKRLATDTRSISRRFYHLTIKRGRHLRPELPVGGGANAQVHFLMLPLGEAICAWMQIKSMAIGGRSRSIWRCRETLKGGPWAAQVTVSDASRRSDQMPTVAFPDADLK